MGLYHSTYWAYGIAVDPDQWYAKWEENEATLNEIGFVDYLAVTDDSCNNVMFITTESHALDNGEYKVVSPEYIKRNQDLHASWNDALNQAVETLGIDSLSEPGYIFVHERS